MPRFVFLRRAVLSLTAAAASAMCAVAPDAVDEPTVQRFRVGDTMVVRTIGADSPSFDRDLIPEVSIGGATSDTNYQFARLGRGR